MRMFMVVTVGIVLLAIISIGWYLSNTLFVSIIESFGAWVPSGQQTGVLNLIGYANIIWGPLFMGIIIVWMIASASVKDVESEIYG